MILFMACLFLSQNCLSFGYSLAQNLGTEPQILSPISFPDGEKEVEISGSLRGKEVWVVQSLSPPVHDSLMVLFIILDSLQRKGVSKIHLLIPYMGYGRREGGLLLISRLLKAAGAHKILVITPHREEMGLRSFLDPISLLPFFRSVLEKGPSWTLVAPDRGRGADVYHLGKALRWPTVFLRKQRCSRVSCQVSLDQGFIKGQNCLLIDDMIDTGETLRQGAFFLQEKEACHLEALATHGLFSGQALLDLSLSPLESIRITNTLASTPLPKFCSFLDIGPFLAEKIKSFWRI